MNLTPTIGTCIACEKPAWPVCRRCTLPVPPPPGATHFQVLQIQRRLHLDLAVLGDQMVRFTQFLAPRRFEQAGPEAIHVASLAATAVKDAYTALRNPVSRAEYWLAQLGDAPAGAPETVPDEIAVLIAGSPGADVLTAATQKRVANLRHLFRAHDEADEAARAIHLSDIRRELGVVGLLQSQ